MDGAAQYKDRLLRAAKFLFWALLFAILAYQIAPMVGTVLVLIAKAVMWGIAIIIALIVLALTAIWLANLYAELRKRPKN